MTAKNSGPGSGAPDETSKREANAEHVAVAAYYLAERRGFSGDQHIEDWLSAEKALAPESAGAGDSESAARGFVEEDIHPDEVTRWAEALKVTPERLRIALQRVGPSSLAVRQFLKTAGRKK